MVVTVRTARRRPQRPRSPGSRPSAGSIPASRWPRSAGAPTSRAASRCPSAHRPPAHHPVHPQGGRGAPHPAPGEDRRPHPAELRPEDVAFDPVVERWLIDELTPDLQRLERWLGPDFDGWGLGARARSGPAAPVLSRRTPEPAPTSVPASAVTSVRLVLGEQVLPVEVHLAHVPGLPLVGLRRGRRARTLRAVLAVAILDVLRDTIGPRQTGDAVEPLVGVEGPADHLVEVDEHHAVPRCSSSRRSRWAMSHRPAALLIGSRPSMGGPGWPGASRPASCSRRLTSATSKPQPSRLKLAATAHGLRTVTITGMPGRPTSPAMKSANGSFQMTVRSVGSTRQRRYDIVRAAPDHPLPDPPPPVVVGEHAGLEREVHPPDPLEQLRQLRRIEHGAPRDREVMVEVLHADPPVERLVQVLGALRLGQHVADHRRPAPRRPGHEHDVDRSPPQGLHRRTSCSKSSKAGLAESSKRRSPKFTWRVRRAHLGVPPREPEQRADVVERPPRLEPVDRPSAPGGRARSGSPAGRRRSRTRSTTRLRRRRRGRPSTSRIARS